MKVRKGLRKLKGYKPGKPIEELKRVLKLEEVYKLASNEAPFYPAYARRTIIEEIRNLNRYPEASSFYLRRKLARTFGVKDDEIVLGNGSDEIIVLALRALVESGDEVIVGYPTFLIYELQAQIHGARIKQVALKNFKYDLEAMAKCVTKKTKFIFIANPDNPCSTFVTHKEVESFLRKIPRDILVYFDEAYYEFAPRATFPKTLEFLKKRGNIIFSRTFSKAYGLAGLRVGYAIASRQIAQLLNKIREPFNINRIAQVAALAALKDRTYLRRILAHTEREKAYLYRQLGRLGLSCVESATNFILVDFKKNTDKLYTYLLRRGIIVREMKSWGLNNCFRVTVGLHKENVKFIRCLESFMKSGRKR